VLDLIKRLNRLLHDDRPEEERLPDDPEASAQLLELIELEGSDLLSNWLSLDRSSVRISVAVPEQTYLESEATLREIREFVGARIPESWGVLLSGQMAMGFEWIRDIQGTQLRSFPTAALLSFALVAVFLRSVPLALPALFPTLVPIVVTLGGMGWMGVNLDVGRAMLAAVLVGIAIDDSVHVLHGYKSARAAGANRHDAMDASIHLCGPAAVTTSISLSLGFLTLMLSAWQTIASFGFFIALGVIGALVTTLFVLPAIFFVMAPE
jgi:predicted RND superfamily exporter protein